MFQVQECLKQEYNKFIHKREYEDEYPNIFVEIGLKNNAFDYFIWNCTFYGRPNTIWEGGEFKGQLIFDSGYPDTPPKFYFYLPKKDQKFYHMNVYQDGEICLSLLNPDYSYKPSVKIVEILQAIEQIFYNPNPGSSTDINQSILYCEQREEYDKKIREFVQWYMNNTK